MHTKASLDIARKIYMDVVTDAAGASDRSWEMVFNLPKTTQDFEIFKLVDDFGYAGATAEGANYGYETRIELYEKSFYPVKYTNGYGWTEEAEYTDQYDKLKENARLIGESFEDTLARAAADVFNNGFDGTNYAGIDGVELFDTAHPTQGGTTWSNRGVAGTDVALNALTFGQAIQDMLQTKSSKNRPVKVSNAGVVLHVPPALLMTAKAIENSVLRPGTANNDSNVQKEFLNSVKMNQHFTSSTAWFLTDADKSKLGLFMLGGLPRQTTMDPEPGAGKTWFYTREAWVTGWKTARRTWGTTGA